MADHTRFGPAGIPQGFRLMKAKLVDVPKLLRIEDLDAFEYAAVRWGQEPQIKKEDAQALGLEAKKYDILLSLHGSYFINLFGNEAVVKASKQRIIACAQAADWMGAYVLVFHAGFYGNNGKLETLKKCVELLREISGTLKSLGIKVKLGPETMGRHSQFGSLEEILEVCREVEDMQLVIDWSHLHARTGGGLRTIQDFRDVVLKAEKELGAETVRNMHCHFSKIEFTYRSGERRHHVLDELGFGPDFEILAEVIREFNLRPTIICETALQDLDSKKMRKTLAKITEQQSVDKMDK